MMDESGEGDWRPMLPNLEHYNMRIVGYVEQVYKPAEDAPRSKTRRLMNA